ncbi:extracellular solute-binding protein, partial [Oscillochloris sp. ZM17-4]|uniref:extracellular solute-binding protein n=1 Tax=Oscillochloris sp. ZM17-4 TaxID=2866714 RepID=UPI001C736558
PAATEAPAAPAATEAPAAAATEAPVVPTLVPSPTPIPLSTVGSGTTKIVWWHISTVDEQRANWENLANQYVQANPDVSIEITVLENEAFKAKLATAMQSGSPPDIFQSWGGGVLKQYADAGLIQDLTPALAENGWGDSFNAGPLSLYAVGGKNYGVPWNAGMVGFWYNKDLFAKAGIDAPPATWAELLDDVGKLKAAGITPIAIGEKDKWPGAFWWEYLATRVGGQAAFESAFNRTGKFTDPAFVEAGAKLKELVDLQPFQTGSLGAGYGDQQVVMANGQAAMELMGQWAPGANRSVAENVDAYNASLGWFPFPMVEGGAGSPTDALGGGDGFAVGKNAPPAAIDFVRFLTSVENQTAMAKAGFAVPPVIKGAEAGIDDPLIKELTLTLAKAQYYQLYYDQYMPPAVGAAVNDATQEIFAGTASPEQVAQTIEDSAAFELQP